MTARTLLAALALVTFAAGCTSGSYAAPAEPDWPMARITPALTKAISDGPEGTMAVAGEARFDDEGRIQVYAYWHVDMEAEVAVAAIEQAGGRVELIDRELAIVQAYVPPDRVRDLAYSKPITKLDLPVYGKTQ